MLLSTFDRMCAAGLTPETARYYMETYPSSEWDEIIDGLSGDEP